MPAPSRQKSSSVHRARRSGNVETSIDAKKRSAGDPNDRERLERQQLDDYIKRRSEAIDRDIEELRHKLGSTASSLSAYDAEAVVPSNDRHAMRITGASVVPRRDHATASTAYGASGGNSAGPASVQNPDLRAFLSMLNDAVYEAGLSVDDIWSVLPRGTSLERPYVSIFDLRDAMEIDLMLPFDDSAEKLVVRTYAVNGDIRAIDVVRLFADAGIQLHRASTASSSARSTSRSGSGGRGGRGTSPVKGREDISMTGSSSSLRILPDSYMSTTTRRASPYGVDGFGDTLRGDTLSDDSDLEIDIERRRRLLDATSRSSSNRERDVARQALYNDAFSARRAEESHGMQPGASGEAVISESLRGSVSVNTEVPAAPAAVSTDGILDDRPMKAKAGQSSAFDDLIEQANKNVSSLGGMRGVLQDLPLKDSPSSRSDKDRMGAIDEDDRFIDSILERYGSKKASSAPRGVVSEPAGRPGPTASDSVDVEAAALRRENERLRRELAMASSSAGSAAPTPTGGGSNGGAGPSAEARLQAENSLLEDIGPSDQRDDDTSKGQRNLNGQSLDRLARYTKQSIRAMDRAGLIDKDPVYNFNRSSSLRRSSPLFDAELVPVGSGPSPSYLPRHMTTQYSLAVPESHTARQQYFIASDDTSRAPDGATFSDLCERRLIFEISNHREPLQVYKDLLRGIVEIARSNGVDKKSKDLAAEDKSHRSRDPLTILESSTIPESSSVSSRYVTPVQLFNLARQLQLNLSLSEVQLIAAGFASDGAGGFDVEEFCEALKALMYSFDGSLYGSSSRDDLNRDEKMSRPKSRSRGNSSPTKRFLSDRLGGGHRDKYEDGVLHGIATMPQRNGWTSTATRRLGSSSSRDVLHESSSNDASSSDMDTYWMIAEFDFVDELLTQLEGLTPVERRRRLLSLRHMLWNAETSARSSEYKSSYIEGDDEDLLLGADRSNKLTDEVIDGFSLLKCLVNSGFDIPRAQRAKFLTAMERMGGRVRFTELFRILMSGCCDWPKAELAIATKLLTAMGATVPQRRVWIARLRSDLNKVSGYSERESPSRDVQNDPRGMMRTKLTGKKAMRSVDMDAFPGDSENENPGVSASAFLYALRDLGAALTIEEEAVLLDCLDLERQCEIIATTGHTRSIEPGEDVKVPLVYYKSFLSFCTRHAGDWTMFLPDLFDTLKASIARHGHIAHDEVNALKSVFVSFDDKFHGRMPRRSFLVACRRSLLFEDLSEEELSQLAEVLSADGGGTIDYRHFMYYLQSLALVARSNMLDSSVAGRTAPGSFKILASLMDASTDADGTFVPLRTWLLRALEEVSGDEYAGFDTDVASKLPVNIPHPVFVQMLRDFGVVYDNEDLDQLLEELDLVASSLRLDSVSSSGGHRLVKAELFTDYVDVRALFVCLFKIRGPWTKMQPALAEKLCRCYETAPRGAVRRLMARLDSFAVLSSRPYVKFIGGRHVLEGRNRKHSVSISRESSSEVDVAVTVAAKGDVHSRIVRRDVFLRVAEACGVYIEEDDAFMLSDATDISPAADYVEYASALLLPLRDDFIDDNEAADTIKGQVAQKMRQVRKVKGDTDNHSFAMKHFRSQMMKAAAQQKRTLTQWICDVDSVFRGFDRGGGFVTVRDFKMAMKIVGVHISSDLLSSLISTSGAAYNAAELVDFESLLSTAFTSDDPSVSAEAVTDAPPASRNSAYETQLSRTRAGAISRNVKRPGTPESPSRRRRVGADANEDILETAAAQGRKAPGAAVKSLVHVIRRGMERFIVDGSDMEEAAHDLISVLYKFDANNDGFITPRDFCLAVSILLGGDDIVLSKEEWAEIISYFAASANKRPPLNSTRHSRAATMVDYVSFVEMILDTAELRQVKAKLLDLDETNRDETAGGSRISISTRERLAATSTARISTRALLNSDPSKRRPLRGNTVTFGTDGAALEVSKRGGNSSDRPRIDSVGQKPKASIRPGSTTELSDRSTRPLIDPLVSARHPQSSGAASARGRSALAQKATGISSRPAARKRPNDASPVSLTLKQRSKAISMGFTEEDIQDLKEIKSTISDALELKSSTGRRSKHDILYESLMAEDTNRSGSLSMHSVIAVFNSLGIRSKHMREFLIMLSSQYEDKQIVVDDLLDLFAEDL